MQPNGHGGRFVLHEHGAARVHWDLRLEASGVLKCWALPRGPSMSPLERRPATMVADHPLEHLTFEGIIPPRYFGAGPLVFWDRGTFATPSCAGVEEQLAQGRLELVFRGDKLKGAFTLARAPGARSDIEWVLHKRRDAHADAFWQLVSELTPARLAALTLCEPPCETP